MLTRDDMYNLEGLLAAIRQHPSFGVGTDPALPGDIELHESMLRLEAAGLVRRAFADEFGTWWQAVLEA